jgi:hypothetical protein
MVQELVEAQAPVVVLPGFRLTSTKLSLRERKKRHSGTRSKETNADFYQLKPELRASGDL